MQLSMFEQSQPVKRTQYVDVPLYDWQKQLNAYSHSNKQSDFVGDIMPDLNIMTFKSGSSAKTDLLGYMSAGSNIGICATDASKPVLSHITEYVSNGGHAFIDSGAFRNYKARLKDETVPPVDFDEVLSRYDRVVNACTSTQGLIVVAPDIVGEQEASYELLKTYQDRVVSLYKRGASIMVPLQKGELSLTEHYLRCSELLGFDFICGVPSNAKAVSQDEIMSFIDTVKPSNVHFLGAAESALAHAAKHRSPTTRFSCDATVIRKHIGQNRLLTEMQNQILDDVVTFALNGSPHQRIHGTESWDETEVLGDILGFIESLSPATLKRFATALCTTTSELLACDDNQDVWDLLDTANYGYACNRVIDFLYAYCSKSISPSVRKSVVHQLASLDVI